MISWWAHLSWSQATQAVLLAVLVVGYVLTDDVENPRAWRFLRAVGRFVRRYVRKLRPVQATRWDGAIVLAIPAIGWSLAWLQTARRVLTSPWCGLCAWVTQRRVCKPPREWAPIDYSAKRARALEQLGDDYLLARPIKRRSI